MVKKKNTQLLNFLLITVGSGLTLYAITAEDDYIYLKVVGIIFLMFGLYRATNEFIVSEEERKNKENDEKEQ